MNSKLYRVFSYHEALETVANLLADKPRDIDKLNIIFTPEKNTMLLESQITEKLGGYLNTRVFSFGKYLKYNHPCDGVLSREGSVIVIRKILSELSGQLKCFKGASVKIAENLYDSIALLKSAKVDLESLSLATSKLDGLLKSKIEDLSLVYDKYEQYLKGGYYDEGDVLSLIPAVLNEDKKLSETDVYLVGFDAWTVQARNIVSTLISRAKSVTAVLVSGSNDGVYTNESSMAFMEINARLKCKVDVVDVANPNALQYKIVDGLYSEKAYSTQPIITDKVELYECATLKDEVTFVAKDIAKKVRSNGARFKDFAIALPSAEEYSDVLARVFADYKLPYYLDEKRQLSSHPIAKIIIAYLEMVRKNLSQDTVLALVKNPLFVADKKVADDFENYVIKKNLKYTLFNKEFDNIDGENDAIEKVRKIIVSAVFKPDGEMKVDHFIKKVNEFAEKISLKDRTAEYAESLKKYSNSESEYTYSALSSVSRVLDFLSTLAGDTITTLKEFILMMKSGFSATEISMLPQLNDGVYVGAYRDVGNAVNGTLYAIGLNGDVPEIKQDIAVLGDGDISRLADLKVIIEPKVRAVNAREREIFATALTAFSNKLYLTYSVQGNNGKALKKSDAISYLKKLFALNEVQPNLGVGADKYLVSGQAEKRFAYETGLYKEGLLNDYSDASAYYYATLDDGGIAEKILKSSNTTFARRIDGASEIVVKSTVSASLLESFYACPFKCFMDYGVSLKEREVGKILPKDTGDFIHKFVELYAERFRLGQIANKEDSDRVTEELIAEIFSGEKFTDLKQDPTTENTLDGIILEARRVSRELYKQLHDTDFKIVGAEVSFGYPDSKYPAVRFNTRKGEVCLRGKVDRVDKFNDYYRVIDYKTGKAEMSDAELYMGKKLQLYLYLNAFRQNGETPAGTYYYKLSDDYGTGEFSAQLDGKTVREEVIVRASDTVTPIGEKSAITGVKMGDETALTKKQATTISKEGIIGRMKYAKAVASKAVDYIKDGVIVASPYKKGDKSACSYCPYFAVCSFEKDVFGKEREINASSDFMDKVIEGLKEVDDE